jgi:hypothetical protein
MLERYFSSNIFLLLERVFLKHKLLLVPLLLSWSRFWRFVELPAGRS